MMNDINDINNINVSIYFSDDLIKKVSSLSSHRLINLYISYPDQRQKFQSNNA